MQWCLFDALRQVCLMPMDMEQRYHDGSTGHAGNTYCVGDATKDLLYPPYLCLVL